VAAVVEDTSEHGGTAAGPVVRDIVKAYYDKKEKKAHGQSTAQNQQPGKEQATANTLAVAEAPKVALKREGTAKVAQVVEKKQEPE
jgi:hypothetical protein